MFKAYIKAHNIISVLVSNAIDLFIIGGRTGTRYVGAYLGGGHTGNAWEPNVRIEMLNSWYKESII